MIDIKSQIIKPALNLEDLRVVASAEGWGLTDLRSLGFFLNRNFKYRRAITITEQSGSDLTDYQVLIELNSTNFDFSHAQTNGEDIRFTDASGNLLDYWIEEWDSVNESAKVWVKVPSIPANSSVEIYMYYGNPSASSASDASATFIRVIDGLVGAWHFDEGSGNIAHDSSGNDNDGTITGAIWVNGKFGKALEYDGDDEVSVPYDEVFNLTSEQSYELWLNTNYYPSYDETSHGDYLLRVVYHRYLWIGTYTTDENYIEFMLNFENSSWTKIRKYGIPQNEWVHVIATYDGHAMRLYINGVEEANKSVEDTVVVGEQDVFIPPSGYHGMLDEVRIYNKALTGAEISDIYNNYGYTTENYPGKVLVRKYTEPEPSVSLGEEETA